MDRNRKILIAILAVVVLSTVIAILDITMSMKKQSEQSSLVIGSPQEKQGPGVALVRVDGTIQFSGQRNPFGMETGTEATLKRLDAILQDPKIKAVVIRINSPGGTVAATQELYQKIWKLRKKNIPVIASVGEIAASGGYYIASACDLIVANHGSITGSIGVIAMSPNLKALFEKIGISMTIIKSGKYKDVMSSHRDLVPEEKQFLQEMIDSSYRQFLKDIALGRNQPISDIEPYADGRVMSGQKALELKLIDKIGTFEDALILARQKGNLPENAPLYDGQMTPFQQFLMSIEGMVTGAIRELADTRYRMEYR